LLETVVIRLITDKPVKKTAYQVKGVFMKHYPDSSAVPMLDGTYRDKFLYPRVQVKILNEQIYVVGIKEGANSVRRLAKELTTLNFGNITFEVIDVDVEVTMDQFKHIDQLLRYKFVSPWVALGNTTQNRYKFLKNKDRIAFLNKLLGQNIVFLGREMDVDLNEKVYTKIRLTSLLPKPVDEDNWGAFTGEFQTNFILPDFIGIGNGITRGYGAIHGLYNPENLTVDETTNSTEGDNHLAFSEEDDSIKSVVVKNVPKPRRKSKSKKVKKKKLHKDKIEHTKTTLKNKPGEKKVNKRPTKTSEQNIDDDSFNTAEYHKKQHTI
jgi:hypothetical protein